MCDMWFTGSLDEVLGSLNSSRHGLSRAEAAHRLDRLGPNILPEPPLESSLVIFLRQFANPFIYILLVAVAISLILKEWSDASFIAAVVVLNAIIGAAQETKAERSAQALRQMVTTTCRVVRDGEVVEIEAAGLVPGDVITLASGDKVPADARLLDSHDLHIDESLLTGESLPVSKQASQILGPDTGLADRVNMAHAGTLVTRGRGSAVIVSTGLKTEVGAIASDVAARRETDAPLLMRMRRFTHRLSLVMVGVAALFAVIEANRGTPLSEVALVAIALAVSAIPEGLPVALTVALAIGVRRMAQRHVIVRRLAAVESLGSCTAIASDKTGTLTVNELTASVVALPSGATWNVTGVGTVPEGEVRPDRHGDWNTLGQVMRLARSGALCNEAVLLREDDKWTHHGDTLDVSLLVLALKLGITQPDVLADAPLEDDIPFESERRFAATLHQVVDLNGSNSMEIHVKGAIEAVVPMCSHQQGLSGDEKLDPEGVTNAAEQLSAKGFRVIALASGTASAERSFLFNESELCNLTLLGLVAMIDPARPDAAAAVSACIRAGLRVLMVTGDHPSTALAIAKEVGIAKGPEDVVTGAELRYASEQTSEEEAIDELVGKAHVFARVEPAQKLAIVESLIRNGELVAVTGDGANDAPALHQAHVGLAMGKSGTDVAREAADLIVTDDKFSSIASGIEEGRVAYGNVRKVISLLISTGAGEVVLFFLTLLTGMPAPLTAVQLLWLNLVTNGIQDVALAFEPGEGDEMQRPPRPPSEPVFNRLMLEKVGITAVVIGIASFVTFRVLLDMGWSLYASRNAVTALMVLLENVLVLNTRSETRPFLDVGFRGNPLLILGMLLALGVHLGAMHFEPTQKLLQLGALPLHVWAALVAISLVLFLTIESYKLLWRRRLRPQPSS